MPEAHSREGDGGQGIGNVLMSRGSRRRCRCMNGDRSQAVRAEPFRSRCRLQRSFKNETTGLGEGAVRARSVASFLRFRRDMAITPTHPSLLASSMLRAAERARAVRLPPDATEVVGCTMDSRAALIGWLDDGLRDGRHGRLEAEYPVSLASEALDTHRVVYREGAPLSHAMYRCVTAYAPEPVRVGMIGLVYTDPAWRGRGLAARCIESCCEALEYEGAVAALLWSDKPAFYARMGFESFGVESRWLLDATSCRAVREASESHSPERLVDVAAEPDWPRMEALYADKSHRIERSPGDLERLAKAPESICVVARRAGRVVAYAALGRGDDFRGVIHEWAGAPGDVLACFEALCRECGPLLVQAGPDDGALHPMLGRAGVPTSSDPFALARIFDADHPPPDSLYLWGFDSI